MDCRSITPDSNARGNGVPLTQMNGRESRAPPLGRNTQLLTISYQLREEFTFTINGAILDRPESLTISLENGGNYLDKNIIYQLAAKFYENKLYVNNGIVQSEEQLDDTMTAGDLLNGSDFNVSFECRSDYDLYAYTNNSIIRPTQLNDSVNYIRYINLDGSFESIKTLSYNFGNGLRGDQIHTLPEWPRPKWPNDNSIVLLTPKLLQSQNIIAVSGSMMNNPNSLTISLVSDNAINRNIACQLEARFDENTLKINKNNISTSASDLITGLEFNITFTCREGNGENYFDIYYNNNLYLDQVITDHNFYDIRYVVLDGNISNVKTLEFQL